MKTFVAAVGLVFALSLPAYAAKEKVAPKAEPKAQAEKKKDEPKPSISFMALKGTWRGGGSVQMSSGGKESISCRATYTPSSEAAMTMTTQCATSAGSYSANVSVSRRGNGISGSWSDSYGSGTLRGTVNGTRINVTMFKDGVKDTTMSITTNGNKQSVSSKMHDGGMVSSAWIGFSRGK